MLGPFIPLVDRLGRLAVALVAGSGIERVEVDYFGRIAERDTRLLTLAVLQGVLAGHCEEDVNLVNAPSLAEERGIAVSERKEVTARDFTDLVRITIVSGEERLRVAGTMLGRYDRPHLLEAWGQRFNLQLDEGAHLALFRYCDLPGMMGRVGTALGEHGVNISSAAVGRQPQDADGRRNEVAVMVVTTDSPGAAGGRRHRRGVGRLHRRPRREPLERSGQAGTRMSGSQSDAVRTTGGTATATGRPCSGSSAPSSPRGPSAAARPRSTSPARPGIRSVLTGRSAATLARVHAGHQLILQAVELLAAPAGRGGAWRDGVRRFSSSPWQTLGGGG